MSQALVPGEAQELERMMVQYGDGLLRLCWMLLHDLDLAKDAAQETFLRAYRSLHTLRGGETEKAWLSKIAVNVCSDVRRSRWWRMVDRRMTPDDLPSQGQEDRYPDEQPLLAVMNLPDKYRKVVLLHYYEGLALETIASALHTPAATIRSRLKRAKDKLREELKGWYYDEA